MATHTICKASQEGIGFSAVDLSDVRHVFAAAVPRRGATLAQQAADALSTIDAVISAESARGSIVQQAVFLADISHVEECRCIMRRFYGREMPATSYIPQPPCDGKLLAIEALGVGQRNGGVSIERISEQLVVARHNGIAWAHCAQVSLQSGADVYQQTISAMDEMQRLLRTAGTRFDQIVRTWIYLGGITEAEGCQQRYHELNRARSDFYQQFSFLADHLPPKSKGPIYPASTGIGTNGSGIILSAVALATERSDILAVPLCNPRQTAAFNYDTCYGPKSPTFSRAMVLCCGSYTTIFVSGTASITGSDSQHAGDAAAQTNETLNNIEALISEENLCRHGLPGLGTSLDGIGLARVYIKRQEDYAAVRACCQRRLGELPTIYALGDICRPELLVEIEAIAFSRKSDVRRHGVEAPPASHLRPARESAPRAATCPDS
jgi:enamine deaminase RidA (YjgF/YER057c/UK114 family)